MKRFRKALFWACYASAERYHSLSSPILALVLPIVSKIPILENRFAWVFARLGELIDYQIASEKVLYNGMPIIVVRGSKGGESISRDGVYEANTVSLLETILKPGMVFLDIGANIGQYSLIASRLVEPGGKVYAIEALPRVTGYLKTSIAKNNLWNVRICQCAISDFDGEADFYISKTRSIGTSSLFQHRYTADGKIKVRCKTLDTFAREMELESIDVIKLDIEGSECSAISGAPGVFAKREPPILIIEFNEYMLRQAGQSCSVLYGLLRDLGYTTFRLDGRDVSKYTLEDALRSECEASNEVNVLAWPRHRKVPSFGGSDR